MSAAMRCYRHPDRETYVSCSECGRPICPECMTPAPVGQRCPEHSGKPLGVRRVTAGARRSAFEGTGAIVTKSLVAINVLVYLAELAQGSGVNANSGSIFQHGALFGPAVAQGDWWRLLTSAFLHYGPLHLGLNMLALWWFGSVLEEFLGRGRFLLVYLVSGLAGSAGALIDQPTAVTVGASGAIFGILGAMLILEYQRTGTLLGNAFILIAVNLAFTFSVPNIAVGGHLGGLAGGLVSILVLSRFGRGHAVYGRVGLTGVAGVVLVGAISVALAYWRVRGYA
jgi:membrane associated rhomboid family serine protease